jgi:hypothetical protein
VLTVAQLVVSSWALEGRPFLELQHPAWNNQCYESSPCVDENDLVSFDEHQMDPLELLLLLLALPQQMMMMVRS